MKRILLTVSALAAMTGAAMAADIIEPIVEEPVLAGFDWTGFYGGVAVGGGRGSFTSVSGPALHQLDDFDPLEGTGFVAGVDAGYDWQMDSFILGINGEVNWSNIEAEFVDPIDEEWHASLDWYAAVSAKAGVAVEQFQIYGKAGLAFAGMTLTGVDKFADTTATASNTNVGWLFGVGAEASVTENLSLFAEYERIDLGSSDYDITGTGFHAVESMSATADVFKVGLHMRQ